MNEESIAASIHMHYVLAFHKSLFHKYSPDSEEDRLYLSDNYAFQQTYQRMIKEVSEQGADSHFQVLCEDAYPEYKGGNYCGFNVARAMAHSANLLQTRFSKRPEDWTWRNLHQRQYTNLPWSKTPLKFFFHREVSYGGNNNSPNVSGVKLRTNRDNVIF